MEPLKTGRRTAIAAAAVAAVIGMAWLLWPAQEPVRIAACPLPPPAGPHAGMVFVPGENDGISHNPAEHTDPAHLAAGADVLLHTLLELAS